MTNAVQILLGLIAWITSVAIGGVSAAFVYGKTTQKISSHETICKERHENIQSMFAEIRNNMQSLLENDNRRTKSTHP
jgi:hypothetical protein